MPKSAPVRLQPFLKFILSVALLYKLDTYKN